MEKIKQKIITGEYPTNSKLPNEFELSKQFNVSRVTLRKAIAGLAEDGLIEKIHGVETPDNLKTTLKTKVALYVERVYAVEDEPVMLECNYFPLPRFTGLEKADLSKSLYQILRRQYHIRELKSRDMVISVALASLSEARVLKKSVGFPLLLLQVCVEDENSNIVHAGKHYIISDRYEFHV